MKFYLPFAVHNHQPVGNFDKIFKKATRQCYHPFLEIVQNYPFFRFSLHISGPLWEWFEKNDPKLIDIIGKMVDKNQIELMLGGFYEPLLPFIPEEDAKQQVIYMRDYLQNRFGVQPKGIWLTERVWTPEVPKLLANLGIEYTLLDDAHFFNAGLKEQEIHGYFITEKDGYPLFVFPISKRLRYLIPFQPPEAVEEYFHNFFRQTRGHTLTYGDDGEKFGLWPKTREWVYKKGWLKQFLNFLGQRQDRIQVLPLGEYIRKFPPRKRIYLPPASYEEMMEWTLAPEDSLIYENLKREFQKRQDWEKIRPFFRGGTWDNFLCKYEETNLMHKKMIYFSHKLRQWGQSDRKDFSFIKAKRHLWQSQCNCAYWHGIFGGLYLGHLREAIYRHLIAVQKYLPQRSWTEKTDYDCDGYPECLVHTPIFNAYFKPNYGGSLIELDLVREEINLTNVLTRRQEAYHKKIIDVITKGEAQSEGVKTIHEQFKLKEPNLDKYLIYDWYQRYSFLDHFWDDEINLERFYRANYYDRGNFTIEPYNLLSFSQRNQKVVLELERQGLLFESEPLTIKKTYILAPPALELNYTFYPESSATVNFGTEINFFLPNWHLIVGHKSYSLFKKKEILGISSFCLEIKDKAIRIEISSREAFNLWSFPIYSVNISEDGAEKTYQGTCLVVFKKVFFKKRNPASLSWKLTLGKR